MKKRGRPQYQPTPAKRKRVQERVSCGMSEDAIARSLSIATETLRKYHAEDLTTGRSVRRAEVIDALYKQMRAGNVSATKKLEEMTCLSEAAAEFERDDDRADKAPTPAPRTAKLGKKEIADAEAGTAGIDTAWGKDLLPEQGNGKPN